MNMYLHEVRSLRRSTIIWTISIVALAALYFALYPGVASNAADFKTLMAGYPPSVQAILGVSLDTITTLLGFYSMIFSFVALCGAIQAMNLGVSILSKETRQRTADFLLVKPVSRASIVSAKLAAALTMIFATNLIYNVAAVIMANMVKTAYSQKLFFMINATLLFIQLIFLAIGLVISVIVPRLKSVLPTSLGTVFGLFMVGALIATSPDDAERFISPFKYFDIPYILKNASYELPYLLFGAAIVVLGIVASYAIYIKKDIHAVS